MPGLRVGHASLRGSGALSGTTVVLAPPEGAVGGVDVRGAAPGTRETDLLDPHRLVRRVHALCLSGGSAYGLAAADGVTRGLEADGVGFPLGPGRVVPIVPASVIFDLGRGGEFGADNGTRPDATTGLAAYTASARAGGDGPVALGCVGAGTGAVIGGWKGGVGTASAVLSGGGTVAALVVANAAGCPVHPDSGELYGARFGLADEFAGLTAPTAEELARARHAGLLRPELVGELRATTLAVLGTDVTLDKAQCTLLAAMGADGLARAVRPVHTLIDGDLTFALSTATRPTAGLAGLHELLSAAADCVTRAIVHAVLTADSVTTPAGSWPAYPDVLPSAVAGTGAPRHDRP